MSEYNNLFYFNAIDGACAMPGSLNAEPAPVMDQSGTWNAARHPQSGLMEGGTSTPLHTRLDLAPFEGARSNGWCIWTRTTNTTCAVCLKAFQTALALDNHAKEANHQAYKCKCGTDFNKHSALQRHINTKDATNTFPCALCSDKFTRKDKLKDHCRHYHRVTDDGLLVLFDSQQVKTRPGGATRRRRAPVPLAAASSASAPATVSAPPTLALAPAGPSVWSSTASTGQQYANFSADLSVPTGSFATTSSFLPTNSFVSSGEFVPAASSFAAAAVPSEDIFGTLDDILGDATWTTNFNGFGF